MKQQRWENPADARSEGVGPAPGPEATRGSRILKTLDLVLAVERCHRGLDLSQVQQVVGGGRRTAYRWIAAMVATGRYEWNARSRRLRRPRLCGTPSPELSQRDDWTGRKTQELGRGVRW